MNPLPFSFCIACVSLGVGDERQVFLTHTDHLFVPAEVHLLASGKRDAANVLAEMMYEWYVNAYHAICFDVLILIPGAIMERSVLRRMPSVVSYRDSPHLISSCLTNSASLDSSLNRPRQFYRLPPFSHASSLFYPPRPLHPTNCSSPPFPLKHRFLLLRFT